MKPSLVILVSYVLASCLPTARGKRSSGLPLSRVGRRRQAIPEPPRGGGAVKPLYTPGRVPIELNPNYVPRGWQSHSTASVTTAVYEEPSYAAKRTVAEERNTVEYESAAGTTSAAVHVAEYRAGSSSWLDNLRIQFRAMYQSSPSLMATMVSCVMVFLAWQVRPNATVLRQYFVLSRANMRAFRWPSLFLSAVSHMDFWHLLVNLYGLWSFRPSVQRTLKQVNQPLGPFLGGAALASSLAFLFLQPFSGAGGALGLSGVTLALLAVHARTHPESILGIRLAGIVPVRMKAENLLICLTAWSFVGSLAKMHSSNIGHAAHLGGLLFGVAYHQFALRKRILRPQWQFV